MNKETKILFTDLDGTLLTSDKQVSKKNLEAIDKMINAGHKFVVATGRPFYSAHKLCKEFGFVKPGFYIVASNGGVIYDCDKQEMILRKSVPFDVVEYIFNKATEAGIHIQTYTDEHVISLRETEEIINYCNIIKMPYKIVDNVPGDLPYEPPKMIVISYKGREVLNDFRESIADWAEGKINSVFSADTLLEYLPIGSTKGNAIIKLCEILNIPIENSIACGDEENDITMIDAAGLGVVMQNGTDSTKAHANYITNNTNDEDGITEVIEKFILN